MIRLIRAVQYFVRIFADWPLPYLVLAIMVWQNNFTLLSLGIFMLSIAINMFNFSLLGTISDRNIWWDLHNYLFRYQNCIFQAYPLARYIPEEALSKDFYFSQEKHLNRYWDKHREKVINRSHIFSVKGGEQAGERPSGLKAFPTNRLLFIFSREQPEEMNPVLRFKIYHEYFHASVPALLSKRRIMLGIGPSFLMLVYFALHIQWHMGTFAFLLAISAIFYTGYKHYWQYEKNEEVMYAELYADHLALKYLSDQDRQFILNYKRRDDMITHDPSLNPLQNLTRKYYFREMLSQYQHGMEPSIFDIQPTKDYPVYIYVVFLVAMYLCGSMKPLNTEYLYFDLALFGVVFFGMLWVMRTQVRFESIVGNFLKVDTRS